VLKTGQMFSIFLLFQHKNDPLFAEFMEMHTKGNRALWSNDALVNGDSRNIRHEKKQLLLNADGDSVHDSGDNSESEDEEEETEDSVAKKRISDLEVCFSDVFSIFEGKIVIF
jgi:hypothetical protein